MLSLISGSDGGFVDIKKEKGEIRAHLRVSEKSFD